jgi:hypothetical protein
MAATEKITIATAATAAGNPKGIGLAGDKVRRRVTARHALTIDGKIIWSEGARQLRHTYEELTPDKRLPALREWPPGTCPSARTGERTCSAFAECHSCFILVRNLVDSPVQRSWSWRLPGSARGERKHSERGTVFRCGALQREFAIVRAKLSKLSLRTR